MSRRSGSSHAASPGVEAQVACGGASPDRVADAGVVGRANVHGRRASGAAHAGPGTPLAALLDRWRADAATLLRRGAIDAAAALESCADELAEALQRAALEELTPAQAARETGFSASAIRRRFPGQKAIRRADLPNKGGRAAVDGPDLAGEILARGRESTP